MLRNIIAILVTAILGMTLAATPILAVSGGSSDVLASVTVEKQCAVSVDTSALTFGNVLEGHTSDSQSRNVSTIEYTNTPTDVTIYGTDWCTGTFKEDGTCDNSPTPYMPVGQSTYGKDVTPNKGLALAPGENLFSTPVDEWHMINFQVTIPVQQPANTYKQTVTIDFSC